MNALRKIGRLIKSFIYRSIYRLRNVDKTVYFGGASVISPDLVAGRYVYIGPGCKIYPKVIIGEFTMLAYNVQIIGGDHKYNKVGVPIIFSGRDEIKPTLIGKDCWLGANTIVICGCNIGEGSIIAAGSVVTNDIEPYSIYGGVPARKIRNRFNSYKDVLIHKEQLKNFSFGNFDEMLC